MQESWPGPVLTGWGGRALQPASSLSSLCKQQRHTDSPHVRAHVCALAGGLQAWGTHRLEPQMGVLAALQSRVRVQPADTCRALTMYRSDPFISSFHPYTPTGTPLTHF